MTLCIFPLEIYSYVKYFCNASSVDLKSLTLNLVSLSRIIFILFKIHRTDGLQYMNGKLDFEKKRIKNGGKRGVRNRNTFKYLKNPFVAYKVQEPKLFLDATGILEGWGSETVTE